MKKSVSWILLITIYLGHIAPVYLTANAQVIGNAMNEKMKDVPDGLKFRLSEGVEGAEARVKQLPAATDPLSESDTIGLLKRIPEIKTASDDKTEFAKRIGTLPAPKTGNKIPIKFPSDELRAPLKVDPSTDALQVVRYSPEGEIPLDPDLSVTF